MPLAHAQALVPDLVVVDATPSEDTAALRELAAWCLRFSPLTAADPPDGVWIDVTGCAHLHGGEEAMRHLLLAHLGRHGVRGRAAAADTPGAAHALARFEASPVTVAGTGAAADALACLPTAALRIDGPTVAGLRLLGLDRVGQLETTARGPLARRFGPGLLLRLDQALGRIREAIEPVLPPETVAARREFVEPISTPEAICIVILLLVQEACTVLDQRGAGVRRLDLVFERVDGTVQVVRIGTARPVRNVRHLARLLDERIEEVDPGPGIEAMRLVLPCVEPLHPSQDASSLMADKAVGADLSELVDRLLNRLGAGRVYRLDATESDVPERSQQAVPVLDVGGRTGAWVSAWPRPVRLLSRPEPVEALALLPSCPPRAFTWRRVRHLVAHADGPERITGEWWHHGREAAAVRDYWTVETQAGRRFWLYRQGNGTDPATGGLSWFLHGFF